MLKSYEELWRVIESIPRFEISSLGRIRNSNTGTILKVTPNRSGYLLCRVGGSKSKKTIRPHKEVAIAFVPNPENKPQVNHKDGNKSNNEATNLEWCTNSENQSHAVRTGLRVLKSGEDAIGFKRCVDVYKNGEYIISLNGNAEMEVFGVDYRNVSACVLGKRKTHRGYTFKIKEETL